ncbi:hypothetical protein MKW98_002358 [Papaver atlanticum]|uniref:Uncharacterized protein n=1 Tax=Papaver atlanticum TaxID=357466 RepID=A0AAD4SB45_9MAGN|nr:hypothetical protein MKW98_002358 [Papaver atlanticum]
MKVEVVSTETIKPSYPTPNHLRTFNLSFLDQLSPPIYVPIILFYPIDCKNGCKSTVELICDNVKKSLSETLNKYYPLAGRVKDSSFVECNDDGVEYIEAKVHDVSGSIFQIIQDPNIHVLRRLLPFDPYGAEGYNKKVILSTQINVLEEDCGGIVIGICISHKIGDGSSLTTFINDWAAAARGVPAEQINGPQFDLPSLFPLRDLKGYIPPSAGAEMVEEIVTKKFVFEASKIAELKKHGIVIDESDKNDDDVRKYPTRVEALSAFIWRRVIELDQTKKQMSHEAPVTVYGSLHAVNMRARMIPPLPSNSFGNMYGTTMAFTIINNHQDKEEKMGHYELPNLVEKVKESIKKIDSEYVKKVQTTDELLNAMKHLATGHQMVVLSFSSWCKFPIYEADFGWGKPIWVTTATFPFKNVVVFMDTKSGDGIEAWVNMTKDDMSAFEHDKELLQFASPY